MKFHIKRYFISGIVTIIPLWVTWLLFEFTFQQLSKFGTPIARAISKKIRENAPSVAKLLLQNWFQEFMGALIVLFGLYALGWSVNRVIGKKLLNVFEKLVEGVPFVQRIYGSVKKIVAALQTKPHETQRVVLIDFPNSTMKAVGLVTRTMIDKETGEKFAVIYVPTTPNPTSGYLEIVPLDGVISTDWTIDEAMSFVVSGGTVAPERFSFSNKGIGKGKTSPEENSS